MKKAYSIEWQKGLTLIELMLVVGIISLLFGIGFVGLGSLKIVATKSSSFSVLSSDLKNQQIKAMVGDTEGRGVADNYGIKIFSDSYVLFHGNNYNESDTSNFSIPIDQGYTLSTTFPGETIIFASDSGELVNFSQGQSTITITHNETGSSNTMELNSYGTIISSD